MEDRYEPTRKIFDGRRSKLYELRILFSVTGDSRLPDCQLSVVEPLVVEPLVVEPLVGGQLAYWPVELLQRCHVDEATDWVNVQTNYWIDCSEERSLARSVTQRWFPRK
jgi:hypothetical protein